MNQTTRTIRTVILVTAWSGWSGWSGSESDPFIGSEQFPDLVGARYCSNCGTALLPGANFCSGCSAPASPRPVAAAPFGDPPVYAPPLSPKRSRTIVWVVVGVAGLVVAAAAAAELAISVASTPKFSFTIVQTCGFLECYGRYNLTVPLGSQVSGSWMTSNGATIEFVVDTPGGSMVYFDTGYSGSFSFKAVYPSYFFLTVSTNGGVTTSVSGTY